MRKQNTENTQKAGKADVKAGFIGHNQKHKIDEFLKKPKKALFILAWPMMLGMFAQVLYNIVDTAFVGRLGTGAIAALTFSFPVFFLMISINSGLGAGVSSLIARYVGAKKLKEAGITATHGFLAAIAVSLLLSASGLFFLDDILNLFGAEGEVFMLAKSYLRIIFMGMAVMMPAWSIHAILNGQGDTKTAATIQIIALVLNIALDPIFIYVLGYGVAGAAIATVISMSVALILGLGFLYSKKSIIVKITLKTFKFSKSILSEIFKVGLPTIAMNLFLTAYVTIINIFMAHYGTEYVAAFGLGVRLESLASMFLVSLTVSMLTLVGMFYGAGRTDLVKSITFFTIKIGLLFMTLIGALFFLFPEVFFRIFTDDVSLLATSSQYMRIIVFTFPAMAITMTISRAMQGLGDGIPGLMIVAIRVLIGFVPVAYLFVYVLEFGFIFVPLSMVISGVISVMVAFLWLRHKFKNLKAPLVQISRQ